MISLLTLSILLRADSAFAFDVKGPGGTFVVYLSTESGGALVDFGNGLAIFHSEKEWVFVDRKPNTLVVFDKSNPALYDAVSDFASACFPLWPDMSGPVFSHAALLDLVDKSSKGTQAGEYVPQQSFKVRAYKPTTIPGVGEIAALTFKHPFIKGELECTIFKLVDPDNSGGYENLQGMIHPPKSNEFAWTIMPAQSDESLSGLAWRRREASAAVLTKFDRDAYKKVESSIKPEPESIFQDKFLSRFLLFGRGGSMGG